jgi:hypothetical protein
VKTKELIAVFKTLAIERLIERMTGVIELDEDVLGTIAVVRASSAEHYAELRPILISAGPASEGDRCPVHTEQSSAAIDKFDEALPQLGVFKEIAYSVVQKDGIKLPQILRLKD